ncbi:regulatory protein (GGDEF domain) [Legionella beliardensis]|uniref:Regulatory protein (GGDEF domain) n=1 Tax=Legionella beliardensis TaxID=91822 RepID=A0A378I2K6_9GAMM|nr:BLUF domain-containing protein [Legionella beliardensis]STX29427.1 regulatory protein (GGDEF domain) [Legionella beliardensis]
MSQLVHLIYVSTATNEFNDSMLINLLKLSRENNNKKQITGILLYKTGSFFQVLEGADTAIELLIDKIKLDPRHQDVTQIIYETIFKRDFAEWSMGFVQLEEKQPTDLEGLNDFFDTGNCLANLDAGRAKKILHAFSKGYWQKTIR